MSVSVTKFGQNIHSRWQQLSSQYLSKLSGREIGLVACGTAILLFFIAQWCYNTIDQQFSNQKLTIQRAEISAQKLADEIEKYIEVRSRRDRIEKQYREIEMKEEPRSFVESLISKELPDVQRPSITLKNPRDFGGSYKREGLTISFNTANYKGLIGLLKEMVEGDNPLIVSKLKLDRSGNNLRVNMDVDSIRRK